LEAGVFLVSVKLIMMAHKNSILAKDLSERLHGMEATLSRLEQRFEPQRPPDVASHPAENEMR
jgi:hypothetical protein